MARGPALEMRGGSLMLRAPSALAAALGLGPAWTRPPPRGQEAAERHAATSGMSAVAGFFGALIGLPALRRRPGIGRPAAGSLGSVPGLATGLLLVPPVAAGWIGTLWDLLPVLLATALSGAAAGGAAVALAKGGRRGQA